MNLSAVYLLVFTTLAKASAKMSVPLYKHSHHQETLLTHWRNDKELLKSLLVKNLNDNYFATSDARALRGDGGGEEKKDDSVVIRNHANTEYYGTIDLGSPLQPVKVMFDTRSSDFWIPSVNCTGCDDANDYDKNKNRYNHTSSSSYKEDGAKFDMAYVPRPVTGFYSFDTVTLTSDLVVGGQRFAEITDASGLGPSYKYHAKYDGSVGLYYTPEIPKGTVLENAVAQNVVEDPIFAFYLADDDGDSELTFGGYDDSKFEGKLTEHAAKEGRLNVNNITAAHYRALQTSEGVIDSSSSYIVGPFAQVRLLANQLGASRGPLGYYIHCNKVDAMPDLVFSVDGTKYTIPGRDLIVASANGYCSIGLDDNFSKNEWILGDVFMRMFYTVFNYADKTVSLAKAK